MSSADSTSLRRRLTGQFQRQAQDLRPETWDLHQHGVTAELLRSFSQCRECCRLRYQEGWADRTTTITEELRAALDWMLVSIYRQPNHDPHVSIADYEQLWHTEHPGPNDKQLRQHATVRAHLCAILEHLPRGNRDRLATEWIPFPSDTRAPWRLQDGRETFLRGRLLAFADAASGQLGLCDIQVRRSNEPQRAVGFRYPSWRAICGLVMLEQLTGFRSVILNQRMLILSQGRHRQLETEHDFSARVRRSLAGRDDWIDDIRRAVTADDLQQWKDSYLSPILEDLAAWHSGGLHYPNLASLPVWSGYTGLINRGDASGCYRSPRLFPELDG